MALVARWTLPRYVDGGVYTVAAAPACGARVVQATRLCLLFANAALRLLAACALGMALAVWWQAAVDPSWTSSTDGGGGDGDGGAVRYDPASCACLTYVEGSSRRWDDETMRDALPLSFHAARTYGSGAEEDAADAPAAWESRPTAAQQSHYRVSTLARDAESPPCAVLVLLDRALAESPAWRSVLQHEFERNAAIARELGRAPHAGALYRAAVDAAARAIANGGLWVGTAVASPEPARPRVAGYLARWIADGRWLALALCAC